MNELWQLYDEVGNPITGKGATKDEVMRKGLLHGSAHVWIWRKTTDGKEILLQKRAANKRTFPNMLDISAAGHIRLDEPPKAAAIREAEEEIGLIITEASLTFVGKFHINLRANADSVENEFRWVYTVEISPETQLSLSDQEVAATKWLTEDEFRQTVLPNNGDYVPQGDEYFKALLSALEQDAVARM